jgi:flagellar motor switch protein FliN/FliY
MMADDNSNLAESLEAELNQMTEDTAAGGEGKVKAKGGKLKIDLSAERDRNLDLILDIPLKVTVELGRTKMVVSDLLNLGQGSVIELSKLAGEPMEVLVNDKLVARGEAVVVNEKFGVRLTDIISPSERVEQLK